MTTVPAEVELCWEFLELFSFPDEMLLSSHHSSYPQCGWEALGQSVVTSLGCCTSSALFISVWLRLYIGFLLHEAKHNPYMIVTIAIQVMM